MSTNDSFEASRSEKLQRIAQLGIDPWGVRFDNHQPIAAICKLPADLPEDKRLEVRAAGRIVSRRIKGKLHFLDIVDSSGDPVMRATKGDQAGKHEATEVLDLSSRIQVMIGQKQVGETGWGLAQELDLGDLIGVDGNLGKTQDGRADHLRRQADVSDASRCCRTRINGAACRRWSFACAIAIST